MTKRTGWFISLLSVYTCLAGCTAPPVSPAKPEPLTFVATDPAVVSGGLASVAEQTFNEGLIYASTGLADAAAVSYGKLKGDGSFSFPLPEQDEEWFPVTYELPEECHQLASDLSGDILTVIFGAILRREDSEVSATVVQASSRNAPMPEAFTYGQSINIFSPHNLVGATIGEFVVFWTYADKALRVQGDCVLEGQTARLNLSLKKGWNLILIRREAASVVGVKTIPGMPKQAKWFTLSAFRW